METRMLGRLWPVSALTLGGGGVGQLWGLTTRDECIATVRTAVDCGITLLDMAPAYGNGEAENVVGAAFDGRLPAGIRVTTKHRLGTPRAEEVENNMVCSLNESLARMRLEVAEHFGGLRAVQLRRRDESARLHGQDDAFRLLLRLGPTFQQ